MAKFRVLRAAAAGNRPTSLEEGQLFVDEHDGKLILRNPAGGVREVVGTGAVVGAIDDGVIGVDDDANTQTSALVSADGDVIIDEGVV